MIAVSELILRRNRGNEIFLNPNWSPWPSKTVCGLLCERQRKSMEYLALPSALNIGGAALSDICRANFIWISVL
jgi:hypothetical protein